jgi:hypothetical protein
VHPRKLSPIYRAYGELRSERCGGDGGHASPHPVEPSPSRRRYDQATAVLRIDKSQTTWGLAGELIKSDTETEVRNIEAGDMGWVEGKKHPLNILSVIG